MPEKAEKGRAPPEAETPSPLPKRPRKELDRPLWDANPWLREREWRAVQVFLEESVALYRSSMNEADQSYLVEDETVNYTARELAAKYLQARAVPMSRCELVVVAALHLSCKYWHSVTWELKHLLRDCSVAKEHTAQDVLEVEREILCAAGFLLPRPPNI